MEEGGTNFLYTLLLATTLSPIVLSQSIDYPNRTSLEASSRNQEWECEGLHSTKVLIVHPDGDGFTCEMFEPDEDIWKCRSKVSYGVQVFSPEGVGFRCSGNESGGYRGARKCYMMPQTRVEGFVPDGVGFMGFVEEDEHSRVTWRCNIRTRPPPGQKIFSAGGMTFLCHEVRWTCKLLSSDLDEPPTDFIFDYPGARYSGSNTIGCKKVGGRNWSCNENAKIITGPSCKACHYPDVNDNEHCQKDFLCEERMNSWPFFP